jgi:hypothetical protein
MPLQSMVQSEKLTVSHDQRGCAPSCLIREAQIGRAKDHFGPQIVLYSLNVLCELPGLLPPLQIFKSHAHLQSSISHLPSSDFSISAFQLVSFCPFEFQLLALPALPSLFGTDLLAEIGAPFW